MSPRRLAAAPLRAPRRRPGRADAAAAAAPARRRATGEQVGRRRRLAGADRAQEAEREPSIRRASWASQRNGSRPQGGEGRDQVRAEGPGQGADADESGVAGEVRATGRGRLPDQTAAAGDRAPVRDDDRRLRADHPPRPDGLCALAEPDRRVVLDHYHYEDFARKVVGVGSVGTEALMILLMGDAEDRPAVPADQGGQHLGPRAVCRRQRVQAPGRAGGARPAAHAGCKRRVPGMGSHGTREQRARAHVASCAT